MNYLLDTNIISETIKTKPNTDVIAWLNTVPASSLYISVISLGEIRKGVESLNSSSKKSKITHWLEFDLPQWFDDRILSIDARVCHRWGCLLAHTKQTLPAIDSLLAALALQYKLTLVTRNHKDFRVADLQVINPWQSTEIIA